MLTVRLSISTTCLSVLGHRIPLCVLLGTCAILSCFPVASVTAEELTLYVMPIERKETALGAEFTLAEAPKLFPNVRIDNPPADWQDLHIGWHRWLCGEAQGFAESRKLPVVHIKFIHWFEALHNLKIGWKECDVLQVPSTWCAHLIREGALAEWGEIDAAIYWPNMLNSCKIEGEAAFYAVPWHADTRVLFLGPGIGSETQQLDTWNDLKEALQRRKNQDPVAENPRWKAPLGIGLDADWDLLHNTFSYFFEGEILKREGRRWRVNFSEGLPRKGVEELCGMTADGLIYFHRRDSGGDERITYDLAQALIDGRCDAVFGGPHMRVAFENHPDIRALPLPRTLKSDKKYSFLGGCHLGVSAAARRRGNYTDARALVEWLTGREAQVALAEKTDAIPARKDALLEYVSKRPRWRAFADTLEFAQPYPSIPEWADKVENQAVLDSLHKVLLAISHGEKFESVGPQLDYAAAELQKTLNPRTPVWVWWLVSAAVVIICLPLAVYAWRKRAQYRLLLAQLEQKETEAQDNAEKLQDTQPDTAKELVKISDAIDVLVALAEETRVLLQEHKETSVLRSEYEEYISVIRTLIQSVGTSVPEWATVLGEKVEILAERLDSDIGHPAAQPTLVSDKVAHCRLADCDVWVNFGYDARDGSVTMELTLSVQGRKLATRKMWTDRTIRLFELAVRRLAEYEVELDKQWVPGLNLSDIFLVHDLVRIGTRDAASRWISRHVRQTMFRFMKLHSEMKDNEGNEIEQTYFLLPHRERIREMERMSGSADKSARPHQVQLNADIDDFGSARKLDPDRVRALGPTVYRLVWDDAEDITDMRHYQGISRQVNRFHSNIVEAYREAVAAAKDEDRAKLCSIVLGCPRALDAWHVLLKLVDEMPGCLTPNQRQELKAHLPMFREEAKIYDEALRSCKSPGGQRLQHLFGESDFGTENRVKDLATVLNGIVNKLKRL